MASVLVGWGEPGDGERPYIDLSYSSDRGDSVSGHGRARAREPGGGSSSGLGNGEGGESVQEGGLVPSIFVDMSTP